MSGVQDAALERLRRQAKAGLIRITLHAHQEMAEDEVSMGELIECFADADILEDYPEHKRGPCCLICAQTARGRWLHVVSTTALELIVVITVYEPTAPKWKTPHERERKS